MGNPKKWQKGIIRQVKVQSAWAMLEVELVATGEHKIMFGEKGSTLSCLQDIFGSVFVENQALKGKELMFSTNDDLRLNGLARVEAHETQKGSAA